MDTWYYSREDLAEKCLKVLEIGISSNLSVVAPRRKGKTLFMLNDLASLAVKRGYVPVYISLWQNVNFPQQCFLSALQEALGATNKKIGIRRILKTKVNKVSIGNELIGKVEMEFSNSPKQPTEKDLNLIDNLLTEFQTKVKKKTVLLLIDEAQHLATSPHFDSLTYALRTMLDKRLGKVKAIFTGSSRHYMNLLFNKSKSPFYNFVESIPFPDLDEGFLQFILNKLDDKKVSLKDLKKAFDEVDKSPYWLMKMISYCTMNKISVRRSVEHTLKIIEAAEGFENIYNKMRAIDKIVFLALSSNENVFSKKMFKKIEEMSSVKGIPSNIQRSIKRLIEYNLVSQMEKGAYYIEMPGLKKYILSRENALK